MANKVFDTILLGAMNMWLAYSLMNWHPLVSALMLTVIMSYFAAMIIRWDND